MAITEEKQKQDATKSSAYAWSMEKVHTASDQMSIPMIAKIASERFDIDVKEDTLRCLQHTNR